ncbi:hypothetical protein ONS95_001009 [Cadophora gregata]|uniref:uncharacterized protein n=1 Tax=Cadophora gregata TaxID=51156 RepID=UPI0026DD93B0|nr:uncharacterized protein ONS95_001009 [Cadophora gregata]KAK0102196.1 hypothetical protein ONS96_006157 [Cadophora gregata f. sp. sojae]KAK0129068.1 hypothetical protein ONS95_001009 [Cadophora gregata]
MSGLTPEKHVIRPASQKNYAEAFPPQDCNTLTIFAYQPFRMTVKDLRIIHADILGKIVKGVSRSPSILGELLERLKNRPG